VDHACLVLKPAGQNWVFQSQCGLVYVDVTARLSADDNLTLLPTGHVVQDLCPPPSGLDCASAGAGEVADSAPRPGATELTRTQVG
jgi:hypothetical protein